MRLKSGQVFVQLYRKMNRKETWVYSPKNSLTHEKDLSPLFIAHFRFSRNLCDVRMYDAARSGQTIQVTGEQ